MRNKITTALIFIFAMLSITGCNLPLPTCDTTDLQQVTLLSPDQLGIVDTLTPTLEWSYPSTECNPQGYAITLWEGPVLVENIGGGTGNPSTTWGPGSPLEYGRQYRWTVAPINGTTLGPVSETKIFFTGPVCSDTMLAAPTLLEPADGALFNETTDLLWWDYDTGCTPEGYQVDVSTDPAFSTTIASPVDIPLTRLTLGGVPLTDCETYYWRVAARNGATLGTYSPTRTFIRDQSGTCDGPGGTPPASASIRGVVWHDLCVVPDGPTPSTLPIGCIESGSGTLQANGIQEADEPGIAGVQVDLHFGGCATESVASVLTGPTGEYQFEGLLAFGSYCVAVRSLEAPNDSILIPGKWTYPYDLTTADAFANATVDTGTILTDIDFGWDYQFLPAIEAATAPASASSEKPAFMFDKNAFCRKGPGINYPDLTAIPAGDTVEVLGISPDAEWYFINWSKFSAQCWVAISTGHLLNTLENMPIVTPPPTPVPTLVPPTAVPTATPVNKKP